MQKHLFFFKSDGFLRITVFLICANLYSQTTLVAELTGNPLDTGGWTYLGGGGGGYVNGDEFVFTDDLTAQQGAIYFSEAFNLNQCKKWRIEFETRIWGNGDPTWGHADGMAFWYLENPPTNFASGGTLGIPMGGRGIFIMMDTFDNAVGAPGMSPMSEIQLYYGEMNYVGNSYENDPTIDVNYIDTTPFGVNIRNSDYQQVVIEWDNGNITVSLAGIQIYSGALPAHDGVSDIEEGYFGFSGATGAAHDKHSIRNVYVYMDVVELNTSNTSIAECDANGDGYAQFDLTSEESNLIDNPENYTIEYYA